MTLESRLRRGLHDGAGNVQPEVEARLLATVRTERRGRTVRRVGTVLALAAIATVAVLGGRALIGAVGRTTPATHPSITAGPIPSELPGTYVRVIRGSEVPGLPEPTGRFELRLSSDGALDLATPDAFGRLFGTARAMRYSVAGDVLTSSAFFSHCGEPMTYLWVVRGDVLRLTPARDEPCRFRQVLFTGGPWMRVLTARKPNPDRGSVPR